MVRSPRPKAGPTGIGLDWNAVRLADYNPEWAGLFEAEKAVLSGILGSALRDIQHVGSTSVPGLRAKPVIDIAAALDSLEAAPRLIPALEAAGYEYHPEIEIPGEHFLRKTTGAYHLHLLEEGSPHWTHFLRFRDCLRASSDLARQYAELKAQLAARFSHDRASYTSGKAAFIEQTLKATGEG